MHTVFGHCSRLTLALSLAVAAVLAGAPLSAADPSPAESLFDGKTLAGWHIVHGGNFTAKDGVLQLRGGLGWLRSERQYQDFVLTLDIRWLKPVQDSGIFLRAGLDGKPWPNRKVEVQAENSGRLAMLLGVAHTLDKAKTAQALKGLKEWNTFEVRCQGRRCEVKLNGQLVSTSDQMPTAPGYLGFQAEYGDLDFRAIRIQVLPAGK